MWFDSWSDIARILVVGTAAYVTVVLILRFSGKRTLSKLNAFDWVISVAFGSTLATILLSSDVTWAEGAAALALLAALQFAIAWTTAHLPKGRSIVTARPTLLMEDGRLLPEAMVDQRTTVSEVHQAIRATGTGDLADVAAVVLESDGSLSVITQSKAGDRSALEEVRREG